MRGGCVYKTLLSYKQKDLNILLSILVYMEQLIKVAIYMTEEQRDFISQGGNRSFFIRELIEKKRSDSE